MKNIETILTTITFLTALATASELLYGKILLQKPKSLKFMTVFSISLGISLVLYISGMAGLWMMSLFHGKYLATIVFLALIASPFLIGTLSTYEKSLKYINIQVFVLVLSAIALILKVPS